MRLKWADVDLAKGMLTLRMTKAGERQFAYLNEAALTVLRKTPRIDGNDFVIAGNVERRALNYYRRAWVRILKHARVDYFPPHGLRHNYASMLVAAGQPLETVGHLLGHKNSITTRRYAHHRPDQLRKASESFSDVIDLDAERAKRSA